jgi:hypothetical protein
LWFYIANIRLNCGSSIITFREQIRGDDDGVGLHQHFAQVLRLPFGADRRIGGPRGALQRTHAHVTGTHAHTLTHSYTHTLTFALSHTHTLIHSYTHTHTLIHSYTHIRSLTHSYTHTLIHSHSLSHTQVHFRVRLTLIFHSHAHQHASQHLTHRNHFSFLFSFFIVIKMLHIQIQTWRDITAEDSSRPSTLVCIDPNASLYDATQTIQKWRVHRLPVIDNRTGNALAIATPSKILRYARQASFFSRCPPPPPPPPHHSFPFCTCRRLTLCTVYLGTIIAACGTC